MSIISPTGFLPASPVGGDEGVHGVSGIFTASSTITIRGLPSSEIAVVSAPKSYFTGLRGGFLCSFVFYRTAIKEYKGENGNVNPKSKRAKRVQEILQKADSVFDKRDKTDLQNWLLHTTGKELDSRFCKLLDNLKGLLPDELNKDFATKAVKTRNNITHPNSNDENSFDKSQYEEVAYKLTKIIRAFMLKEIGVKEDIIKDIIKF